MFWLGIIIGVMLGYELNNYIKSAKEKGSVNIFGFEISGSGAAENKKQSVAVENQITAAKNKADQRCNLCNDEDMFITGTKNLIPCPNCNRNGNKFKKLLI